MRLGSKSPDKFMCKINASYEDVKNDYSETMKVLTASKKIKVMLGDSSIIEESTFEPGAAASFYRDVTNSLGKWSARDVMITNNEDCRRVFVKFDAAVGRYVVSGHMSLQFHVLLYYRPEYRVVECQKELSELMEKTKNAEADVADIGERLIMEKLGESAGNDADMLKLFEKFYNDGDLADDIHRRAGKNVDQDVQDMLEMKQRLFKELDGHLVETYRTSDVLIDDARLVTGEEGHLCTFDLERVNEDNSRDGLFDLAEMTPEERDGLLEALGNFGDSMRKAASRTSSRATA